MTIISNRRNVIVDDDEPDEILDESFVMLEEHLRVGVQLVYEHLNPLQHD